MFNGYNETPLISYNEYNQERLEKKQENVVKWSYGHEMGVQEAQNHPNNRHSEFWPGKANFLGVGNVVKCTCSGCYPPSENQSYQGDSTRHQPWLPRTFPVPLNGSNEPCKLPAYQWDNGFSSQGPYYAENNNPYAQENEGKYSYYRGYQNARLSEPNQPGVITSVKEAEFGKKGKNDMMSPAANGAFCSPGYNLTKRPDGRNYCEPNNKHSNVASYSVDQHLMRLPVVEPFIKAVPSNLNQNRVPSTGYRSVKDNMGRSYIDPGYGDSIKMTEPLINGEKRPESLPAGQLASGTHIDYSHPPEAEPQKLFFDNARHSDYYSRNDIQDLMKRNNQALDNRKDCAVSMSEHHYMSRLNYQGTGKPPYEAFYPKDLDKKPENPACFQRNEDVKNENVNVHARLPRSALLFNDPRFADRTQNSFPYQSNSNAYRNYLRPEYPYQGFNSQERYEYPGGFQRDDISEFRPPPQQTQVCEQFAPTQQIPGYVYEPLYQQNSEKIQQFYLGKEPVQVDNVTPNYLEAIRSEDINKNGASKISPLRLLRKKKFINVPHEPTPVTNVDAPPGLDVRKFWSTWADEEEENVAPTQMVVLDCQNIDPEQAKLLHLYETDPDRAVHLETGVVLKNVKESSEEAQQTLTNEAKIEEETNSLQNKIEKEEEISSLLIPESESKSVEPKTFKKGKLGKKKAEVMDKWTEKKFGFLKRAEESKAAEILRHEEEKKKIIETRLTLQQSLKKSEKPLEKNPPLDENSQSGNEDGNTDAFNLPTCEYRRNKFLDYSERNVVVNEKSKVEPEIDEIKKKENIKVERADDPTNMMLNVKLIEENGFEMEDILKKMSAINFEASEIKFEDKEKPIRKIKKQKKKKTEQVETDERKGKLTVETVTKPTIKFSIQKSHDLKISFKVLNNKEEIKEDAEDKGSILEDTKNSTEFTLRYKTFQRDGDRVSSLKKRRFKKKKRIPEMKTPVLKIKKSRYLPQEEKDPLVFNEQVEEKTFSDGFSNSDGFQVQESVDSAKIKLTFKRQKGNFETEYKINGHNIKEVDEELNDDSEIRENVRRMSEEGSAYETGIESCRNSLDLMSNRDNESFSQKPMKDSKNLSITTEEKCDFESTPVISGEYPSVVTFEIKTPENSFEETFKHEESDIRKSESKEEEKEEEEKEEKEEIEEISSDFIKSTKSPVIETNHISRDSLEIENPVVEINSSLENPNGIKHSKSEISLKTENEEKSYNLDDADNQTSFLDLISEEGIDVEEAKITENVLADCLEDVSLGNPDCKNSLLEVQEGLESSLQHLIRDDFLPSTVEPTPPTSRMSPKPTQCPNQVEAEPSENIILNLMAIPSTEGNSEPETLAGGDINLKESETVSILNKVKIFCDANTAKDEPEPLKCSQNDSDFVNDCITVEVNEEMENETTVPELEDGEIIDSSDEYEKRKIKIDFIDRKIYRRHSISIESQSMRTWSRKKFYKAKSCPPELTIPERLDIPVGDIPLPFGPPPLESCWDFKKFKNVMEAKEKPKESISEPESPFCLNDLDKCRNPSPPLGILNRNSKIKFSLSRRSKFTKLNLDDLKVVPPKKSDYSDKKEPKCQTEEVPKLSIEPKNDLETVELLCEDLEENVEVIDAMTELIRDEFYECEDIPTSEDLTNGDDMENEKVNDDKFRNIMQNCLDNAKKFLSVGNLKLFSCSVDDLLELDCQPEPSLEENEPEKLNNHISRDVLLTSCGDACGDDLGLTESMQTEDVSVDLVPSFCSDICPEILPVDNWPYLEEEVTSSPVKPKQDEADLIPALDSPVFEKTGRKRVTSETSLLGASDDGFRICSNIRQRRKTIDSFTAASHKRDISDIRREFMVFKNEDKNNLKCRLSLEKLRFEQEFEMKNEKSHNGVTERSKKLNYKSPSWQPKVMLLRISKNELRSILSTKTHGQMYEEPSKTEMEVGPVVKKQKPEDEKEEPEEGSREKIRTGVALTDTERKRKKSRFRNLHTKSKSEPEVSVPKKEVVDPEVVLTEIFKNCDADTISGKKTEKSKEESKRDKRDHKERRDEERQKDRHRDSLSRKRGRNESSYGRSRSERKEKEDNKVRSPHSRWICEVCGFDDSEERIVHIKNHPFHCQSCHLAFKTESHFISHLTKKHKDIRNQHHCLLCELSFDTEDQYQRHLDTREHKHLESVEKNTINTLFTLLTGAPCPVLGLVEAKPEWLPNQAGTVHFYHQATPLSLALQYLKMHRDLSSFSTASSTHPT